MEFLISHAAKKKPCACSRTHILKYTTRQVTNTIQHKLHNMPYIEIYKIMSHIIK